MNNRFTRRTAGQIKPGDRLVCHYWSDFVPFPDHTVGEGDLKADAVSETGVLVRAKAGGQNRWLDASWFSPAVEQPVKPEAVG